jgi:DnaJ-domain-containing protein 1
MGLNWLTGEAPKQHRMRLAERHEAHGLRCPLGELLDLSVTGLRCKCEQKPQVAKGAVIPLVLQNNSQTIRLMARVVWVRKANLIGGTWQVGLHFLDVRPGIRAAIEQFAKYGFIQNLGDTSATDSKPVATPAPSTTATPPPQQPPQGQATSAKEPPNAAPPPPQDPTSAKYATVEIEDLYRHLGLTINATDAAIHAAYREIAKRLHPDHNSDRAAQEQFIIITKAYGVLRDASKRAKYDAMLRASQQGRGTNAA